MTTHPTAKATIRKPNRYKITGKTATIYLNGSRKGTAQVDAADLARVIALNSWHKNAKGVVCCTVGGHGKKTYLHRFIINLPNRQVDAKNGDYTDCRRANLLPIRTPNRRRYGEGAGAYRLPNGRWRANPVIDGKRRHLGYFVTEAGAKAAIAEAKPVRENKYLLFTEGKWRAYGPRGFYLGTFDTNEEAKQRRDDYLAGKWKPDPKTPGVYFCSEFKRWRANGRDGKYLGRFPTKELALAAQTVYHLKHEDRLKTLPKQSRK